VCGSCSGAGHDAGGEVLGPQSAIEATLDVVQRRSAPGSWLSVVYHSPAPILKLVGLVLRFVGEPLRSVFSAERMRVLLARFGFDVSADADLPSLGSALSADLAHATRHLKHMRIVTAQRRAWCAGSRAEFAGRARYRV